MIMEFAISSSLFLLFGYSMENLKGYKKVICALYALAWLISAQVFFAKDMMENF